MSNLPCVPSREVDHPLPELQQVLHIVLPLPPASCLPETAERVEKIELIILTELLPCCCAVNRPETRTLGSSKQASKKRILY